VVLVYGLGYLDRNTPKKVFPVFLDACLASRYTYVRFYQLCVAHSGKDWSLIFRTQLKI
jgi:hypothetical protein